MRDMANKIAEGIDCPIPALPIANNMTPSQDGIIVRLNDAGEMYASIAKWGFFPSWMKEDPEEEPEKDLLGDDKKSGKNKKRSNKEGWSIATAEKIHILGLFKGAFKHSRCLILIDGFYEWQGDRPPKQPYFIHRPDDGIFAIAGIWGVRNKTDGTKELNYAMITTGPNAVMEPIHKRMPVILSVKDYRTWLDPKADIDTLKALLAPCPDDYLEAYQVSRYVNKPGNNSPDCMRPIQ